MKKLLLLLSFALASAVNYAQDYPYLTFETADGQKTSVPAVSLSIFINASTLIAAEHTFTLTELTKMYFSASDETPTAVRPTAKGTSDESPAIYDLQGRRIADNEALPRGVYIIRTETETRKFVER